MLYNEMDMFREALNYEKRNYTVLSHILGEKDFRTNESNIWLKQFTIKAVKVLLAFQRKHNKNRNNRGREKEEEKKAKKKKRKKTNKKEVTLYNM